MQSIFLALAIYTTNMLLDMEIAGKFAWVILFWTVIGSWNAIERSSQNQTFLGLRKVSLGKAEDLLRVFCSPVFSRSLPRPDPQTQSDADSIIKCKYYQFLNSLKPLPYQGQQKWQSDLLAGLSLESRLPPGPGKNPAVTSILVNF